VRGGRFPVFIEIVPPLEKAILSSRSEFQAKLLTFTYWKICAWVSKSNPTKFLFKSKMANFFFETLS